MATRTTRSSDDGPNGHAPARRERTSRILIRGGALVAPMCAVTAAYVFVAGRFPGDSMDIAGETPAGKATGQGDGYWLTAAGDEDWLAGDTLVQSRSSATTG